MGWKAKSRLWKSLVRGMGMEKEGHVGKVVLEQNRLSVDRCVKWVQGGAYGR